MAMARCTFGMEVTSKDSFKTTKFMAEDFTLGTSKRPIKGSGSITRCAVKVR